MTARNVVTRRLLPALLIAAAVLAFTGCPGMFAISPGGTFTVDFYDPDVVDLSNLQVVVVFDPNDILDDGIDYTYTFPVGQYEFWPGEVRVIRSFECPDVPVGDYFVYAFLDYDGDGVFEPESENEVSRTFGDGYYYIDSSDTPYMIAAPYPSPDPNYTVTSTYAAPLEFTLSYDTRPE